MNKDVTNGIIVGLAIGLFASILFIPEEWIKLKRRLVQRLLLSSPEHYDVSSATVIEEDIH